MIENLQDECGATIFTYKHSKERIAKNGRNKRKQMSDDEMDEA